MIDVAVKHFFNGQNNAVHNNQQVEQKILVKFQKIRNNSDCMLYLFSVQVYIII